MTSFYWEETGQGLLDVKESSLSALSHVVPESSVEHCFSLNINRMAGLRPNS